MDATVFAAKPHWNGVSLERIAAYRRSISETYCWWWDSFVEEDVKVPRPRATAPPPFFAELIVSGWKSKPQEPKQAAIQKDREVELKKESEKFPALEVLREYASEHVLLVGKPGSGKTTTMQRLLLEEVDAFAGNTKVFKLPILIDLRVYQVSILDSILRFLEQHQLDLSRTELASLLEKGQLLLLFDGLNELPSDVARKDVKQFLQNYQDNALIATTRDLSLGGDFGIVKKLEVQPLTQPQIEKFVLSYLPEKGKAMLQQLGQKRLRRLQETPLFLGMLCEVFREESKIPDNLGQTFRKFVEKYDRKFKLGVDKLVYSRAILSNLAFQMIRGNNSLAPKLTVSKEEAKQFTILLKENSTGDAYRWADDWLDFLLKYHLLQYRYDKQIEFRHQLIQEYYAAEYLLNYRKILNDDQFERNFLNCIKWSEPLALMLALEDDWEEAEKTVQLALGVDLYFGARLVGEVQQKFQEKAVELLVSAHIAKDGRISGTELTGSSIVREESLAIAILLGHSRSEKAIPSLTDLLHNGFSVVRSSAAWALGVIGTEAALPALLKALKDRNRFVRSSAAEALGAIGTKAALHALLKALKDRNHLVRSSAAWALGVIRTEAALHALLKALKDRNRLVRSSAAWALGVIRTEAALPALLEALKDHDKFVRREVASAWGAIVTEAGVPALLEALKDCNWFVRSGAAGALGAIGTEAAVPALLEALKDQDEYVRSSAAIALGEIGSEVAVPALLKVLRDLDKDVVCSAVVALGGIGSEAAVPALLEALKDFDEDVRSNVAVALGAIGSEAAVPALLKALNDREEFVQCRASEALGAIGNEAAVPALLEALKDQDEYVRSSAAVALGRFKCPDLLPTLWKESLKSSYFNSYIIAIQNIQTFCQFYNYDIYEKGLVRLPETALLPSFPIPPIREILPMPESSKYYIKAETVQIVENNDGGEVIAHKYASDPLMQQAFLELQKLLQDLPKKYSPPTHDDDAIAIIETEFQEIKEKQPSRWKCLMNLRKLWSGTRNAALKIGEHYVEESPWGKGLIGFLEGISDSPEG